MKVTSEQVERLIQLAVNLAAQQGKPSDGGGQVCECYYTMGQVRHICNNCQAREILDDMGVVYE